MADGYKCRVCHAVHPTVFPMRPTHCPYCNCDENIVPINPDAFDQLDEAFLWLQRRKADRNAPK